MNVYVTLEGCSYTREVETLIRLFFEDADVLFHTADVVEDGNHFVDIEREGQVGAVLHIHVTHDETSVTADGKLSFFTASSLEGPLNEKGRQDAFAANYTEPLSSTDSVSVRKRSKHAVEHVVHQLFERATGEGQPWGMLTGIRPLKLAHQLLSEGVKGSEIGERLEERYRIRSDRASLMVEIAEHQLEVVPDLYDLDRAVSVYIGIPFCPTHCAYCTFPAYSMVDKATYVDDFLQAMDVELAHLGRLLAEFQIPVTSVYLGGGTPTSLRAVELARLMESIEREIPGKSEWREFTVEAGRPDTITPDRVQVMKRYGVSRISVNPQTFKASTLKEIRRGHTPDQVDHRFHYVREAGFDNINMDMIIGLPGENIDDVRYTMERIGRLDPDSVTVHTLSLKRSAVVKTERDRFYLAETPEIRQMVEESHEWARGLGQIPYYVYRQRDILGNMENVGFAKPGKESVYNICIMEERQTIVGIGGGSVTKLIGKNAKNFGRFANPREPKAYIDSIHNVISRKDRALREVFMTHQG